jgi:YebC/PmpR family DNA-binding regulatory protein
MVEALTDNRNRTGAEIRHAFEHNGGSLGEPGSVSWQFEKRGVVLVDGERYGEDELMPAIDAGAEDVSQDGDLLKITTAASDLGAVRSALEEAGVEVQSAELSMEPKSTVEVGEGDAPALLRLMDILEEHDDVDSVHANFDVPEEILERAAAAAG